MIGTIVNTAAVITGGLLGILLKKKMPKRLTTIFFQVIGLFTLAIGISMAVEMKQIVIIVFSLVVGGLIGEWMNIERATERFADFLKVKLRIGSEQFSEGITTAFLLFCVGSMTIMGAIQEGTTGSPDLLFTKSLMDFFSSILLTSALGAGVIASAIPLFLFQGSITLLAKFAGSFFTPDIIMGLTTDWTWHKYSGDKETENHEYVAGSRVCGGFYVAVLILF